MTVTILGEPNAGKSSLMNALTGEDVSIVTGLAGTTRGAIRGFVANFEIIDTPGMLKNATTLGTRMRKSISGAVADADVLLYVLDAAKFTSADIEKIKNYANMRDPKPIIVAVNKSDKTDFEQLYPKLSALNGLSHVRGIVPVSAKTGYNLDALQKELSKISSDEIRGGVGSGAAPLNDIYTTQSVRQMAAEIIRKHLIENLRDEIPHGIAVVVTRFAENAKNVQIDADIVVERDAHKAIVIGRGGAMLKKIGTSARLDIEKLVDARVQLSTHVLVRPNWKNDVEFLEKINY